MGMQLGYTMMTEQAGPKDLVAHVVNAVREFSRGAAQSDDITVMVIRYLGAGA